MKSVIVFLKNVWNAQRNAKALQYEGDIAHGWYKKACAKDEEALSLRAENAALRSQISQRDASSRFAKKNAS